MTNTTRITIFGVTAIVAVAAAGVCHGFLVNRWSDSKVQLDQPFDQIPLVLGPWRGETIEKPEDFEGKSVVYFTRRYVHPANGKMVTVSLTWGRPGPVAVHTPDVCYGGTGYEISTPTKFNAKTGETSGQFYTSQFVKTTATGSQTMRAFWAWNSGQGWMAPDSPRLTFARQPGLLKVYLINEGARENAPPESDPCTEFMPLILPELQKVLFPG